MLKEMLLAKGPALKQLVLSEVLTELRHLADEFNLDFQAALEGSKDVYEDDNLMEGLTNYK